MSDDWSPFNRNGKLNVTFYSCQTNGCSPTSPSVTQKTACAARVGWS